MCSNHEPHFFCFAALTPGDCAVLKAIREDIQKETDEIRWGKMLKGDSYKMSQYAKQQIEYENSRKHGQPLTEEDLTAPDDIFYR